MYDRASDSAVIASEDGEFIIRRRLPHIWQLVAVFLAGIGLVAWLAMIGNTLSSHTVFAICVFGIIAFLTWFTVFFTQRSRDLLMATEFQNAMFASATTLHTQFCLITKQDGTIVYYDPGFQRMFPEFMRMEQRAIDMLLHSSRAPEADRERIFSALSRHVFEKFVLTVTTAEGEQKKVMLNIDPLPRPKGFFLFRGREYVENRGSAGNSAIGPILPLLDHLPVGMYAADKKGALTYVNQTLELWLGYAPGEMLARQMHLQNLLFPANAQPTSPVEPDPFHGTVALQKKNGSEISVQLHQQVHSTVGEAACVGTVMLLNAAEGLKKKPLLTHANGSEFASSDAQTRLRGFIENSPIAIAQLDAEGAVAEANMAFYRLVGKDRKTAGHWRLEEVIAEANHADFSNLLAKARQGHPSRKALATEITHDGTKATVSLFVSCMEEENGETPLAIVHMIDTTEQKNLEIRFAHSQKMQAVGQLAGGIAHDFNNLLTAMIGFCDLLLMRHPAGDQSFADIMQIKQNANRAANLVRQLLAFSRRQTLQSKVLDITDVLAELSNLVRRLIGENIELKMTHGRDLGMVRADQGQLEQVFINLAVNARDAMAGGGALNIRTSNVTVDRQHPLDRNLIPPAEDDVITPGEYVLCEVGDSGTGIPHAIVQQIFEPFFSTKEVGSGTGLGLATCYGIIKQSGGYIYVASEEGKGTSFHLYFPRVKAEEAKVALQETEAEARGVVTTDLTGTGTILLVEDETPVRIFAARALRNKGYTVLEADNGESAIEQMEQHGKEVEVIITDVIMPGMNGPQMIEKVYPQHPHIKVIFISGYAEDAFINTYGTEREFNFLPKPFTLKQLASKVKEVVASGKVGG